MVPTHPQTFRPAPRGPSRLLYVALLVALGLLAWRTFRSSQGPLHDPEALGRPVTARGDLAPLETSTIDLFRKASPGVVHVANLALVRQQWTRNVVEIPRGTGSGFVWDERGYIVTNAHVVEGGDRFAVTLADRTGMYARLVGASWDHDLAVLKLEGIPGGGLRALDVGTSKDLQVGQSVFAIGSPFSLDQTLTTGIISGLDREIRAETGRVIRSVIQTDAAINPGNSGGPLLDSAARVIGVNTAILSRTGSYSGIGFAVPIDTVNRVVPMLIRGEKPQRAGFGVLLMRPDVEERLGIESGVGIDAVLPGSAAEKAGLRSFRRDADSGAFVYDVVKAVDGEPVTDREALFDVLQDRQVGDVVTVTLERDGRTVDVQVTLQGLSD